jgi:hypothetical protein
MGGWVVVVGACVVVVVDATVVVVVELVVVDATASDESRIAMATRAATSTADTAPMKTRSGVITPRGWQG